MTGEQYVRANKRVYNVVIILLAVMTILSVMACLAEFKITILLQTAAAVAGIIVVNTYAKKFWNSKKGGEILLGTGSAVYCVFLLLNCMCFVFRCKVCILWYWCNCSRKYHSYHSAGYYKKSRWDRTFF